MIENVIGCMDQNGYKCLCSTCGHTYESEECFNYLDYFSRVFIIEGEEPPSREDLLARNRERDQYIDLTNKKQQLLDQWLHAKSECVRLQTEIKSLEDELRKFRWAKGDLEIGDPVFAEGFFEHGEEGSKSWLHDPKGKILEIKGDAVLVELGTWYIIPRTRWFKRSELKSGETD